MRLRECRFVHPSTARRLPMLVTILVIVVLVLLAIFLFQRIR
jgi:hypothetical protein